MPPRHVACLYHKDCVDGTTAAAVVLRKFPNAQVIAVSHRESEEDITEHVRTIPSDAIVYIVDSLIGINQCLAYGYQVVVIDHHVGERERMRALVDAEESLTYIFDNDKSGSSLAWSYFFPDEPLPELITYVEDSDLWTQKYGNATKDVVHYLSIWRNNPVKVLNFLHGDIEVVKERGKIISEYTDATIARLVAIPPIHLRIDTHMVPAFNITDHESACGSILAEHLNATVALFTIKGDKVNLSFRGLPHHDPSSLTLATHLGGGGHKNSAGAEMPLAQFIQQIEFGGMDFSELYSLYLDTPIDAEGNA